MEVNRFEIVPKFETPIRMLYLGNGLMIRLFKVVDTYLILFSSLICWTYISAWYGCKLRHCSKLSGFNNLRSLSMFYQEEFVMETILFWTY